MHASRNSTGLTLVHLCFDAHSHQNWYAAAADLPWFCSVGAWAGTPLCVITMTTPCLGCRCRPAVTRVVSVWQSESSPCSSSTWSAALTPRMHRRHLPLRWLSSPGGPTICGSECSWAWPGSHGYVDCLSLSSAAAYCAPAYLCLADEMTSRTHESREPGPWTKPVQSHATFLASFWAVPGALHCLARQLPWLRLLVCWEAVCAAGLDRDTRCLAGVHSCRTNVGSPGHGCDQEQDCSRLSVRQLNTSSA